MGADKYSVSVLKQGNCRQLGGSYDETTTNQSIYRLNIKLTFPQERETRRDVKASLSCLLSKHPFFYDWKLHACHVAMTYYQALTYNS